MPRRQTPHRRPRRPKQQPPRRRQPRSAPTPSSTPVATPTSSSADQLIDAAQPSTALALLGTLDVKGRAPKTAYDRDAFGQAWADTDRNGCDTRNDILARDLATETFKPGTHNCVVLTGVLAEPYGPKTVNFVRGESTSSLVQIDHVVALSNSWQTGSQYWDANKRLAFANDPLNLLAVDGPLNSAKGDGDAATWLPPNKSYRCPYVARQVAVKAKYGLWVTAPERDAIARVLAACPNEPAPTGGNPTTAPIATSSPTAKPAPAAPPPPTTAPPAPVPAPPPPPPSGGGLDPRFPYCKDAIAAGFGPYTRGIDPEYDWYTDRDADGKVCE